MKIVLDTVSKQTICPPDFFDNIRKINDASEITGGEKTVTAENYLEKIINECSKVIANKNDIKKPRRSRGGKGNANIQGTSIGEMTFKPLNNN